VGEPLKRSVGLLQYAARIEIQSVHKSLRFGDKAMVRRLSLFILVACSSFGVGVILTRSIRFVNKPSSAVIATVRQIPLSFEDNERQYHRGPAGLATRGSFITLNSSDGMSFTKWSVYCQSSDEATMKLQKGIRGATKIISREPVYDDKGQQIGERLFLILRE
jgi:hypothetical protein